MSKKNFTKKIYMDIFSMYKEKTLLKIKKGKHIYIILIKKVYNLKHLQGFNSFLLIIIIR